MPGPARKRPQGARTLSRCANRSPSLAEHVSSGPNTLPHHGLHSGGAPPRSSGLCCRVWRTTSDPLRPFLRDPESRARNRGTRRPTCGDGRDSPGLRAARSAHFSGRAAWWGLRNPSPTPPAHFGHNVGGGSSGTQSARKYRPFNLRGTARGPPTGSDVRAPLRDAGSASGGLSEHRPRCMRLRPAALRFRARLPAATSCGLWEGRGELELMAHWERQPGS